MKTLIEALPLPQLYYHFPSQDYWMPDNQGKWIRVTETAAKRYLKSRGFGDSGDGAISMLDDTLLQIQQGQNVAYANKLAGYNAGAYELNGNNVLVTQSPKLIKPIPGDWPLLETILDGMLNVDGEDQRPYLFAWLKRSLEMYYSGKWTQGQVLAFAGPRNSAKSLFQSLLTEAFGGRCAKPYLSMTGRTDFNSDLFQGEHLIVDDECESVDFKARRHFASNIKQIAVTKVHYCHGKNKDALVLSPLWRMTITLNDDPERLLVLPPIADDIEDKISLFKVGKKAMPMPTEDAEQKGKFWNALVQELPAFIEWVMRYEIPQAYRCPRFGVKHYHHQDLRFALNETAPENRLLNLIDQYLFAESKFGGIDGSAVEYTALELENLLADTTSSVHREARQLLTYQNACGAYLGRLASDPRTKSRVTKRILHGTTRWTIHPPARGKSTDSSKLGGGVDTFLPHTQEKQQMVITTVSRTGLSGHEVTNGLHPSTHQSGNSPIMGAKVVQSIHPSTQQGTEQQARVFTANGLITKTANSDDDSEVMSKVVTKTMPKTAMD